MEKNKRRASRFLPPEHTEIDTMAATILQTEAQNLNTALPSCSSWRKKMDINCGPQNNFIAEQQLTEQSPNYQLFEKERLAAEKLREEYEEKNRQHQHELWLQRERVALEIFLQKKEQEEREIQERLERQMKLQQEINNQLTEGGMEIDLIQKTKKEREDALLQDVPKSVPLGEGASWHNPIAPPKFGTEKDRDNCPFFLKTGACRFGERCSRHHSRPTNSNTILIPSMYSHFSMEQSFRDEYDTDIGLEYEDTETYSHFKEFYDDVLPEFKKIGQVIQFKVCCNHEPHLRGNVYVQYKKDDDAQQAFSTFNGRWYGGRQLSCEFAAISRWKSAICGLFNKNRCPKGKSCNFLHVFQNPLNEFHEADWDFHPEKIEPIKLSVTKSEQIKLPGMRSDYFQILDKFQKHKHQSRSRSRSSSSSPKVSQFKYYERNNRKSSPQSRSSSSERSRKKSHSKSRSRSRSRRRNRSRSQSSSDSKQRHKKKKCSRKKRHSRENSREKSFHKKKHKHGKESEKTSTNSDKDFISYKGNYFQEN